MPANLLSPSAGDETLAATLARLAVCAAADFRAEADDAEELDESLDYDAADTPLIGEPVRSASSGEPLAADLPRLLSELNLLYAMVRGEALLRRFAR